MIKYTYIVKQSHFWKSDFSLYVFPGIPNAEGVRLVKEYFGDDVNIHRYYTCLQKNCFDMSKQEKTGRRTYLTSSSTPGLLMTV